MNCGASGHRIFRSKNMPLSKVVGQGDHELPFFILKENSAEKSRSSTSEMSSKGERNPP